MDAFFTESDGLLVPSELTRGPWSNDHQHAGPPAAVVARAFEAVANEMAVVRVSYELMKPIPIAPLRIEVREERPGSRVCWLAAELFAGEALLARARALCMRRAVVDFEARLEPGAHGAPPSPDDLDPYHFPFFQAAVGYHTAMDLRVARGGIGQGHAFAWLRMRHPLVAGEVPSPLQRAVIAADSGNGVSAALDHTKYLFINPDLSIHLHRTPNGEWIGLEARTTPEHSGIGLAEARLYDLAGPIGRGTQSLLIDVMPSPRPRPPS